MLTRLALLEIMSWACENDPNEQLLFSYFYTYNKEKYETLNRHIHKESVVRMLADFANRDRELDYKLTG